MDYTKIRQAMVETQLIPRAIKDPKVLAAFRKVERHKFVPEEFLDSAYGDHPLPIGNNQTISQPYIVALMTECLRIASGETALEVGTGSGYQTAILAELAKKVYSIERIQALADRAERLLAELGYGNIEIKVGDGSMGWQERAPYDAIMVTAACPAVPKTLLSQLADGGRLIVPIGEAFGQALTLFGNKSGEISSQEICGCMFVPLVGKEGWKG